jgi:hypothetical protein
LKLRSETRKPHRNLLSSWRPTPRLSRSASCGHSPTSWRTEARKTFIWAGNAQQGILRSCTGVRMRTRVSIEERATTAVFTRERVGRASEDTVCGGPSHSGRTVRLQRKENGRARRKRLSGVQRTGRSGCLRRVQPHCRASWLVLWFASAWDLWCETIVVTMVDDTS